MTPLTWDSTIEAISTHEFTYFSGRCWVPRRICVMHAHKHSHTRIEGHTFSCTLKIWWRGFPYEWRRKELVRGRRGGQGDFLLLRREEEVKGRGCSTTVTALSDNNFLSLSLSLVLLMARVLLRKSSIILVAWHSSCCIFQFFLKRGTPLAELSLTPFNYFAKDKTILSHRVSQWTSHVWDKKKKTMWLNEEKFRLIRFSSKNH